MIFFYSRNSILLTIVFLFVQPQSLFGQQSYSLDDCLRIARQHSLSLRGTANALQSAQLAHDEVSRSVLPVIKLEGKALNAPNSDHFGYDAATTDGGQFSAQVTAAEMLFDGGARSVKKDQLTTDINRFGAEQRKADRDLQSAVTLSFLDVLQSQEEITFQQERVQELSDYLDLVNRLFHSGRQNYTDVLKTQVSVENGRMTLLKNIQEYASSRISLAEAMGIPEDTSFTLKSAYETPDSLKADSLLTYVLFDTVQNLDLQIADFNLRRSLFDVDIARSERMPSISLTGDIGLLSSGDNLRLPSGQRVSTAGYSLGISVENLLFAWGMSDLRIQQRQLEAENVQLDYERQHRSFVADVRRVRGQIASALTVLRSIEKTIKIAEDNYALTKAQYAGGGTTALEVLSSEQLLAENRLAALQTRADLKRLFVKAEQLSAR